MKKIFLIITVIYYCLFIDLLNVKADVAGLIPCKESSQFEQRLDSQVKKLEQRLSQYQADTPPALALQKQIDRTQTRFNKYSKAGILCGSDGLPHLIADGRWNHAGEFIFPGLLFIYITGWIGWVGRGYLRAIALTNKPTEKEIIIDVPLAFKFSLSGFIWPLAAIQAFTSGDLLNSNDDITVSPR